MPNKFFPPFDEGMQTALQSLILQMTADPSYLDDAPYTESFKAALRKSMGGAPAPAPNLFEDAEDKGLVLEKQVEQLLSDIEHFGRTLQTKDHSEKLAYFKAKTTLIEKLITFKERLFTLKEMADFQGTIMTFLDEVCTKDQVSDLMKRLAHLETVKQ
jgi:hypothetical protein